MYCLILEDTLPYWVTRIALLGSPYTCILLRLLSIFGEVLLNGGVVRSEGTHVYAFALIDSANDFANGCSPSGVGES